MSSRHRPLRAGFTLLELLVVIAIIATLAAVVAPGVLNSTTDAKIAAAKSQIEALTLALQQYRLDNDEYPSSEQGLDALRSRPVVSGSSGAPVANWRGPYLARLVPMDPWGRPYLYLSPGLANPESYDLYSLGRDGRIGGTGDSADLTSWGGSVGTEGTIGTDIILKQR